MENVSRTISWWSKVLKNSDRKKWVMFEHGTVIIFTDRHDDQDKDLFQDAKTIMEEDGPVIPGTPQGDFHLIEVKDPSPGHIIISHNRNMLTVHCGALDNEENKGSGIGLVLRDRRDLDSHNLIIVGSSLHLE